MIMYRSASIERRYEKWWQVVWLRCESQLVRNAASEREKIINMNDTPLIVIVSGDSNSGMWPKQSAGAGGRSRSGEIFVTVANYWDWNSHSWKRKAEAERILAESRLCAEGYMVTFTGFHESTIEALIGVEDDIPRRLLGDEGVVREHPSTEEIPSPALHTLSSHCGWSQECPKAGWACIVKSTLHPTWEEKESSRKRKAVDWFEADSADCCEGK